MLSYPSCGLRILMDRERELRMDCLIFQRYPMLAFFTYAHSTSDTGVKDAGVSHRVANQSNRPFPYE